MINYLLLNLWASIIVPDKFLSVELLNLHSCTIVKALLIHCQIARVVAEVGMSPTTPLAKHLKFRGAYLG